MGGELGSLVGGELAGTRVQHNLFTHKGQFPPQQRHGFVFGLTHGNITRWEVLHVAFVCMFSPLHVTPGCRACGQSKSRSDQEESWGDSPVGNTVNACATNRYPSFVLVVWHG